MMVPTSVSGPSWPPTSLAASGLPTAAPARPAPTGGWADAQAPALAAGTPALRGAAGARSEALGTLSRHGVAVAQGGTSSGALACGLAVASFWAAVARRRATSSRCRAPANSRHTRPQALQRRCASDGGAGAKAEGGPAAPKSKGAKAEGGPAAPKSKGGEAAPKSKGGEVEKASTSSDLARSEAATPSSAEHLQIVAVNNSARHVDGPVESLLGKLESAMHRLAEKGDYETAESIKKELSSASLDDDALVLCATTELYEAFRKRDLKRMQALWLKAPHVKCIHPYEKWSVGYTAVVDSWKRLFNDRECRPSSIVVEDVSVHVRGNSATVTCTEKYVHQRRAQSVYSATNMFSKVANRWLLVHRHVSTFEEEDDVQYLGAAAWRPPLALHFGPAGDYEEVDDDRDDDEEDEEDEEGEDTLAQDTIRALRRLSAEKKLSPSARLRLIQDMLHCPGESMPERAYSLLMDGVSKEERDAAWEDFGDLMVAEARRLEGGRPRRSPLIR